MKEFRVMSRSGAIQTVKALSERHALRKVSGPSGRIVKHKNRLMSLSSMSVFTVI